MYIGTKPQSGFISQEANQYFTGLTQNYIDLNQSISSLSSVIVLVNGVVQENSTMSLTSSTRITLGDTLVSGDKVTCIYVAKISSTQAPGTGTVTNDMLAGSIANSKLATDPLNASNLASGTVPTARLGSGTASSSTFLRGDSTFAEAGGGAWNLIYSDDVSGMGSGTNAYTDSNMFSSTYNFYRIYILDWEPQSDGVNLEIQFKLGGVTRTADYKWNVTRETSNSGGESTNYSNGDDVIRAWYGCGNASGESMSGWFEYTNPTGDTGNWYTTSSMYSGINTSGYAIGGIGAGTNQNSTGPMTGFTIIANTGGLGNYKLRAYGLKQS